MPRIPEKISGKKFGRLTAIKQAGGSHECACDCGATVTVRTDRLKSGKTKSCGCLRADLRAAVKESHQQTQEQHYARAQAMLEARVIAKEAHRAYGAGERPVNPVVKVMRARWNSMKQRCYNRKSENYERYGGRGITVCDEWRENSDAFIFDMIGGYEPGLTLDRRDNDGPYCRDNCRWATPKEQANNRECTTPRHAQEKAAALARLQSLLDV